MIKGSAVPVQRSVRRFLLTLLAGLKQPRELAKGIEFKHEVNPWRYFAPSGGPKQILRIPRWLVERISRGTATANVSMTHQ
jgi:hypothetical protein